MTGINIQYSENEVIWTFNKSNGTLLVQNNLMTSGLEHIYSGPESRSYTYEIVVEGENEIIYFDGQERRILTIEASSFFIDDGLATDGFLSPYIR